MSTIHVTESNFETEVKNSSRPVVIDFWAPWCMPCKQFAPTLEEVSGEYGDKVTVGKIDIDENKALAMKYKVLSIPTVVMFKDGEAVQRHSGVMAADELKSWIDQGL